MKLLPIQPPGFCFPKKDLENPCPCQDIPMEMKYKSGFVFWLKEIGDSVAQDEAIANLEVEKKTVELVAPASGILARILINDGEVFEFTDILGHIEVP